MWYGRRCRKGARVDVKFAAPRGIDGLRFHASGIQKHLPNLHHFDNESDLDKSCRSYCTNHANTGLC